MGNKKKLIKWGIPMLLSTIGLMNNIENTTVEASKSYSHIGTFNGSTTFTTSSSNGINPGLFIEVMDDDGNLTQYESEDGVITVPNTKEGTYVTQAKLLGKTKYKDTDTGEILEAWEEGRNLELVSVENPQLKTSNYTNIFTDKTEVVPETGSNGNLTMERENGSIRVHSNGKSFYWSNVQFPIFNQEDIGKKFRIKGKMTSNIDHPGGEFFAYLNGSLTGTITANPKQGQVVEIDETFTLSRLYLNDVFCLYITRSSQIPIDISIDDLVISEYSEELKDSFLTTNENLTLRGIGDVRDELDLMTGEVTKKIDETIMTGDNLPLGVFSPGHNDNSETICFERFNSIIPFQWNQVMSADWLLSNDGYNVALTHEFFNPFGGYGIFRIKRSRLETEDINGFKKWLNDNPITIQHPIIGGNTIQIINLTNTYTFPQILNKNISIKGTITPTLGSITVPTEALSFTLNPNLEVEQQFIAPEFSVSNDSQAPINLELKSFEQTTDVLNDVLPSKYTSWEGLNKEQSKDIALALEPQLSESWANLNEGSYYVVDTSNVELGQIKGNSAVDFKFSALHGQSFSEILNPQYKLTFVFEL